MMRKQSSTVHKLLTKKNKFFYTSKFQNKTINKSITLFRWHLICLFQKLETVFASLLFHYCPRIDTNWKAHFEIFEHQTLVNSNASYPSSRALVSFNNVIGPYVRHCSAEWINVWFFWTSLHPNIHPVLEKSVMKTHIFLRAYNTDKTRLLETITCFWCTPNVPEKSHFAKITHG